MTYYGIQQTKTGCFFIPDSDHKGAGRIIHPSRLVPTVIFSREQADMILEQWVKFCAEDGQDDLDLEVVTIHLRVESNA